MFTWCSASDARHVAQQPGRSSAFTSMEATKMPPAGRSSHSTSMSRSRLAGRQRHGVGAVGPVDRHAAAPGDEAHDLVAGHRRAAARQPHHDVVEALDVHAGARRLAGTVAARRAAPWWAAAPRASGSPRAAAAWRPARRPTWPTRGSRRWRRRARRGRRSSGRRGDLVEHGRPGASGPGRPSRRSCLDQLLRARSRVASSRRSRENHWRILLAARGVRRSAASPGWARRPRPSR